VANVSAQLEKGVVNYGDPIVVTAAVRGADDNHAVFTVNVPFWYYYLAGSYDVKLIATDTTGQSTSTYTTSGINYSETMALVIDNGALNFGGLQLGGTASRSATMHNAGNAKIDIKAHSASPWTSLTGAPVSASTLTGQGLGQGGVGPVGMDANSPIFTGLLYGDHTAPTPSSSTWVETIPSSVTAPGLLGVYTISVTCTASAG
jgi:hypothetical protein